MNEVRVKITKIEEKDMRMELSCDVYPHSTRDLARDSVSLLVQHA